MPRQKSSQPATLQRKIYFYRIDAGVDEAGKAIKFDPQPVLARISELPFEESRTGRYLKDDDGNALVAFPDIKHFGHALRFGQVRRVGLPQLERAGTVLDLKIADDEGLLETVHIKFFDNNLVASEFNFYAPRMSRLEAYLQEKMPPGSTPLQFIPLLRQDIADQLNNLEDIRLFRMKIRPSYAEAVRQADRSLGEAFIANAEVLDGTCAEIELSLTPQKDKRASALSKLMKPLKTLVKRPDFRENAELCQIRGLNTLTEKVETVDLLHDQLISNKQVLRMNARSRALMAESAYEAIESAFAELKTDLMLAADVL